MDSPTYCNWIKTSVGVTCKFCKVTRPSPRQRLCKLSPLTSVQKTVCTYLREKLGQIKILCPTCSGRVLIKYDSHTCLLHKQCLPKYFPAQLLLEYQQETDVYRLCSHCPEKLLTLVD